MISKKESGYKGESIAADYYKEKGFEIIQKNRTIRGGEIDLILKKDLKYVFVEVKVVDNSDDILGYISKKKLNFVLKTIQYYIYDNDIKEDYRLDAVFVKDGKVFEVYENLDI